jgi:tetratricopeptide (TPR) repeat protein
MVRRPFSTSPSYLRYIRALRDLHALTLEGRDDSPEADAIRDGMDQPWYDLSEVEQRRIKGLSEDLYSISDPTQETLPSNPQVQRKLIEATEARRSGKWDEALELLRRWSRYIDPALLSSMRGTLWQDAGDDATAALFYQHAAELEPTNGRHQSLYLSSIRRSDPDLASRKAGEIIADDEHHPPEVVVTAAGIAFESIEREFGQTNGMTREVLIATLKRALTRLEVDDPDRSASFDSIYVLGNVILARCHALTGNLQSAIRSLDLAIAVDPADSFLFLYRGNLRYGVVAEAAVDDFEKAIRLGSKVIWPYFYLAHHALVSGRFEDCLRQCERGLICPASDDFPVSDEVRALLHEWLAIARAERRYPADKVRAAFEEAIRLTPDADRIRSNLATFEGHTANPMTSRREWIKPRASTVQAFGRSELRLPWPSLTNAA